jgi:hypothetical protein
MFIRANTNAAEMTALLRVMVLKGAPTAELVARMRPEHARMVEEGVGYWRPSLHTSRSGGPSWTRTAR